MRISPDRTLEMLASLERTAELQDRALRQLSSGYRVSSPGDNPAAFALAIGNRDRAAENDTFVQSCKTIEAQLQTGDSALSSAVTLLTRAVSLGVAGATGTASTTQREAIAQELVGIRDTLINVANTSFQGTYLFAGTDSGHPPFELDASSPSGVRYAGNSNRSAVVIADGQSFDSGLPGDQIFADPGSDVFGAIESLVEELGAGTTDDIAQATSQVRAALDHVTAVRVFYGNGQRQLQTTATFLTNSKLNLESELDELVGIDPAEAITAFNNAQAARERTLAAAAKASTLSLLDFLK